MADKVMANRKSGAELIKRTGALCITPKHFSMTTIECDRMFFPTEIAISVKNGDQKCPWSSSITH